MIQVWMEDQGLIISKAAAFGTLFMMFSSALLHHSGQELMYEVVCFLIMQHRTRRVK
jgi:hypothetical protein